jgi:hypothetical protein
MVSNLLHAESAPKPKYVATYNDRHGRPRVYYRRRNYRVALPPLDSPRFIREYGHAAASDPYSKPDKIIERGRPTFVYVLDCQGFTKIGVAKNPATRMAGLQTGSPSKPTLAHAQRFDTGKQAFRIEGLLHRRFARYRTHGEWFAISSTEAAEALREMAKRDRKVA